MRILNVLLLSAIAIIGLHVAIDAQATASIDVGYPNWTNSVTSGIPAFSGSGFSGTLSGGSPTSCAITGRLKADVEGTNKTGGAVLWEQQEWRGTIQGATTPKWTVDISGTVRVKVFTENHYDNNDSTYSADAHAKLRFEGVNANGTHTGYQASKTVSIVAETPLEEGEDDLVMTQWSKQAAQVTFFIKVTANGNISTGRSEMWVNSQADLVNAVGGQAKAYDGTNVIAGGTFTIS